MFVACRICKGQNLVLNGSFEQYSTCPTILNQLDSALFWFRPSLGSPDYYNQCASPVWVGVPQNYNTYQYPNSGFSYAGGLVFYQGSLNYREYLEGSLSSPLTAGVCYNFEMYINLTNRSKFTISDISIYLSDTLITGINSNQLLPYTPQINNSAGNTPDTLTWTLVNEIFTANGGENFFIIGNFKDDASTDTSVYNPQSTYNTSYILIDDVSLTPCTGIDENKKNEMINVFPNPFSNKLNITTTKNELIEVNFYDVTARKIFNQSFINSTSINTEQLAKGIYLYEVSNKNRVIKKGKIVKD